MNTKEVIVRVVIVVEVVITIIIIIVVAVVVVATAATVVIVRPFFILRTVRPRIAESEFRNHCAKKLVGALRKPTSFV